MLARTQLPKGVAENSCQSPSSTASLGCVWVEQCSTICVVSSPVRECLLSEVPCCPTSPLTSHFLSSPSSLLPTPHISFITPPPHPSHLLHHPSSPPLASPSSPLLPTPHISFITPPPHPSHLLHHPSSPPLTSPSSPLTPLPSGLHEVPHLQGPAHHCSLSPPNPLYWPHQKDD